jgi:NAD(P)H-flavin reductase
MTEDASILVERARVTRHECYPGAQHVLRLHAPRIAARARPGSFVHVDCGPEWLLRRPMSLMSAGANGEIEILFKEVGHGTLTLGALEAGAETELLGPIGNTFTHLPDRPLRLLVGGGVGIPPMIYYAEALIAAGEPAPLVLSGSELPFPFELAQASVNTPPAKAGGFSLRLKAGSVGHAADRGVPSPLVGEGQGEGHEPQRRFAAHPLIPTFSPKGEKGLKIWPAKAGGFTDPLSGTLNLSGATINAARAIARLQALGIPNRLASRAEIPGSFRGYVTELAERVIAALPTGERKQVALYACGPTPMLSAVAALAHRYALPCQVSLEEYMACAVGGCAGCTVEVATDAGPAIKRVCVDGPIFEAATVFPAAPLTEPEEPALNAPAG